MQGAATTQTQGLREQLNASPMVGYQWLVISLCFLLNLIDGLDVFAMAFTASAVAREWGLTGTELGGLFSAGVIGMALGSVLIAPLADRWGRRPLILANLLLAGIGMTLSFWASNASALAVLRFFTGLGVGAILASANVMTSEYANRSWRGLAIALQSVGFALGAMLGGFLAAYLNESLGWRYVFLVGGLITLGAFVLMAWLLPESLDFLLQHRAQSRQRIEQLLQRLKQPVPAVWSATEPQAENGSQGYRQLLSSRNLGTTLLLGSAFFLAMFSFYFVMNWTPRLLEAAGLSAEHGIAGGMLLNLGGMAGALLMGLGSSRVNTQLLLCVFLLLTALMLVLMVPATAVLSLALTVGFMIGLLLNGAIAGLYTTAPQSYATGVRTSGVGLVLGFGRVGAIVSPLVAGMLLDAQWQPEMLYRLYAMTLLLACVVVLAFYFTRRVAPPA